MNPDIMFNASGGLVSMQIDNRARYTMDIKTSLVMAQESLRETRIALLNLLEDKDVKIAILFEQERMYAQDHGIPFTYNHIYLQLSIGTGFDDDFIASYLEYRKLSGFVFAQE